MEPENSTKYQKLAAEYSKLRAQASVLKRAVLDEQSKSAALRESLKEREANLRKSVQEVDSLGFRNKQLERTVASLQLDLEELRKANTKGHKSKNSSSINDSIAAPMTTADTQVIREDLAKKIVENSQLMMQMEDRNAEIKQCQVRMEGLNRELQQQAAVEQKLRKELEALALRNTELEAKISEAASTIGSEDGLSVTADMENHYNSTSNHFSSTSNPAVTAATEGRTNNQTSSGGGGGGNGGNCDDRIVFLEKELSHWRAQYELLKIETTSQRGPSVDNAPELVEKNSEDNQIQSEQQSREQKLTDCFTKSIGELFHDKCRAESKLASHLLESQRLQSHLDIMKNRLQEGEDTIRDKEHRYHIIEDELARTRLNYEEQISVLTEQVVSLSEQLASCK
ncbi:protein phosphatase 1 regulatory subunit 21 [Aedes albopictus]|uniref:Protein phosphatase 1 regulatory subunit 21 N-terminal domain-containing protein n=1 Tax=Aedes albopictus TaxID=7160 RepID=A0ABM1XUM4_AEDAL|nr:protein phosphatase 1 regulatory subunit 21-like [Aedes albopictus]XP_029730211.1 protein phosphatase 1 regulatory subunit 21-like [Aedes albopictus]